MRFKPPKTPIHFVHGMLLTSLGYTFSASAEKPELMLLIDASSSMENLRSGVGYPAGCEWPRGGQAPIGPEGPGFSAQGGQASDLDNLTKMQWVQWQLAGGIEGPLGCVGHDPNIRVNEHAMGRDGFIPHYRLMCQANAFLGANEVQNLNSLVPCGADHGRQGHNGPDPDTPEQNASYFTGNSGFIQNAGAQIRFGLMVSDSDPKNIVNQPSQDRQDWSMGAPINALLPPASNVRIENSNIPALYSAMESFAENLFTSTARDPRQAWVDGSDGDDSYYLDGYNDRPINLGARGADAPHGRFIAPKIGISTQPELEINHNDQLNLIKHNLWVARELRKTVPHGPSPISAMLSDLREYYVANPDPCQSRVAVLVTDGLESTYLPTRRCNVNNHHGQYSPNCNKQGLVGKCVNVPQNARISHERFAEGSCQGNGSECQFVCVYPEGSPYESAVSIARSLHDELGIPVVVALVGHPSLSAINYDLDQMSPAAVYAYQIAAAGSPNLGPAPGIPGIYSIDELGSAIDLVNRLRASEGETQRSETQPLVMSPGLGDAYAGSPLDPDLRQMRISASGYTPAQDSANYSDVSVVNMGCNGILAAPRGLRVLQELDVDQSLNQQSSRPVFTVNPQSSEIRGVVDTNHPLFRPDGEKTNNDYEELMGPQNQSVRMDTGLRSQGYFGAQGREGTDKKTRVFGGISVGDLAALPPTGSPRENSGDPDHYRERRERPNLFFFGGDDGLVHAIRAFDGYNLFSFVPFTTWRNIRSKPNEPNLKIDGPLVAGELIPCRSAAGGGTCPSGADAPVKSMLVGGVGEAGRELFGFELSRFSNDDLRDRDPRLNRWPNDAVMWSLTHNVGPRAEASLGLTVSRPALAHVNLNGEIKGVAVVGCGNDHDETRMFQARHGEVGRCLLFVDITSGEVLHKIEGPNSTQGLRFPIVGSPTVYPNDGSAAEVVYFGDLVGQLFRLDLVSANPNEWSLSRIWPLANPLGTQADFQRGIGHSIFERPALANADNGDRIVIFATSAKSSSDVPEESTSAQGYMVSLRERVRYDALGRKEIVTEANWVLDFAGGEYATGAPKIQDKTAFITTVRPGEIQGCGGAQDGLEGRLYGAHFTKVLDTSYLDPFGDRALRVVPMIPRYNQQGERIEDALSLILPSGRTAHGFSLVPTPSCSLGASTVTELVLNLSDEFNAGPNLLVNGLSVEYIENGFIAGQAANQGAGGEGNNAQVLNLSKSELNEALEVKMEGSLFTVSLSPGQGDQGGTLYSPVAPFPSKVFYWGSGDEE